MTGPLGPQVPEPDGPVPPAAPPALPADDHWQPSAVARERERLRRRRARRSTLVAAASTGVAGVLLAIGVTSTPGWDRVRASFLDVEYGLEVLPRIAEGLWLNVRVAAVCAVVILVLGLALALARTARGPVLAPLRIVSAIYTDLFRGLPLILVIFLMGLGVPGLRLQGAPQSLVFYGAVALVLTYSAYVAEVFRAGIDAVHPSQRAAARSLGLGYAQTMRFVVLPQAVRKVVPPLLNDLVSLMKDSGLISILGALDAVQAARRATAVSFNFTPYVVAGVLFVLLTIPLTRITDWVTARAAQRQQQGGAW